MRCDGGGVGVGVSGFLCGVGGGFPVCVFLIGGHLHSVSIDKPACLVTPDTKGNLWLEVNACTCTKPEDAYMHAPGMTKLFNALDGVLELRLGVESMRPELVDLEQPSEVRCLWTESVLARQGRKKKEENQGNAPHLVSFALWSEPLGVLDQLGEPGRSEQARFVQLEHGPPLLFASVVVLFGARFP